MHLRPDFVIHQLRGNVDTRLRKLKEGQYDAIILAAAGVKRLGLAENVTEYLDPAISLPAIGQGALGIECRVDDRELNDLIAFFNHADSRVLRDRRAGAAQAARRRMPGADRVLRRDEGRQLHLTGLVGSVDGKRIIKDALEGAPDKAEKLGVSLAETLLTRGADAILRDVYGHSNDISGNNLLEN